MLDEAQIMPVVQRRALWSEFQRVLAALTAVYEAASETERARIAAMDDAFTLAVHHGDASADPKPLIRWARTVVPGAFPPHLLRADAEDVIVRRAQRALRLPSPPSETQLERPPSVTLYHGTRAWQEIRLQGLCVAPGNQSLLDPEYGWDAYWADEQWRIYKTLTREQKRRLHGREAWTRAFFRARGWNDEAPVALFFATELLYAARSYGGPREHDTHEQYRVLRIDPAKIRYYWWSRDDLQGDRSYVFAMPTDCPQALPDAFTVVDPNTGTSLGGLAEYRDRDNRFGGLAALVREID